MSKVIVRYKLRPEEVRENIALLRAFFDELAIERPSGLVYEAYLLEDGLSFVHLVDSATGAQPFGHLPGYRRYRDTVAARCTEPPQMIGMDPVGAFNALSDWQRGNQQNSGV